MEYEGAEAKLYPVRIAGKRMLVKRREPKGYRIAELDNEIREGRTRREARITIKLRQLGANVPAIIAIGRFSIWMEEIDGKLLAKLPRAKRFYELAGKQLALMHSHDIIHGDFTPANIMVFGKKVFVIDFGLAEQNPDPEGKAIDLLLMKRSLPLEMYSAFEKSYIASGGSKSTLSALSKIELRGRYQKRTLG